MTMPDNGHDRALIDQLITDLKEAPAGNRRLDLRIAYCLATLEGKRIDVPRLLIDAGFSFDTVSQALEDRAPPYTTSLDAPVAGERIVLCLRSEKRGAWGAVHRGRDGTEILAWGKSECLARRIAALKAVRRAQRGETDSRDAEVGKAALGALERSLSHDAPTVGEAAQDDADPGWKVMF